MNGKILILSTTTGILAICLVFLIVDVSFNVLPDDIGVIVIVLFIGSCTRLLMRHLLDRSLGRFRQSVQTTKRVRALQTQSLLVTDR